MHTCSHTLTYQLDTSWSFTVATFLSRAVSLCDLGEAAWPLVLYL